MSNAEPAPAQRVLLVTHDASRTGAPMVALLVARSLVEAGHDVRVVSCHAGPLMPELASVTRTRPELLHRVRRRLWLVRRLQPLARLADTLVAVATVAGHRPDVLYVNSSAAAAYLRVPRRLCRQVVLHVHESAPNTRMFLARAGVGSLRDVELVACSPRVRDDLRALAGRDAAGVHLLPSVPDRDRVLSLAAAGGPSREGTGLVVGATGSVGHRKGTDLWLQVAERVGAGARRPDVGFVWVGDLGDPEMAVPAPGVRFLGARANPYPEMARFDVATLPSRDDPFPLVVLEAMILGLPVVAFDVGSVREQVGDAGILVPPEDVAAFAAALGRLLDDDALRSRLGAAARRRAAERFSSQAFASRLLEILAQAHRTRAARTGGDSGQ